MISQDPSTLGEVLADIRRLGEAADAVEAADELLEEAADRLDEVQDAVETADPLRVAALEWLDPVFVGGHWVPQMIELAGGEDVLGFAGEKSRIADVGRGPAAARPEVVVSMPCGYYAEQAAKETMEHAARLAALGAERVDRGRRRRLLLAARPAAGRRRRAARPPAAPRPRRAAARAPLDRARPAQPGRLKRARAAARSIEAPPQACFDAITDYETFPDWQDAVESVEVVSRYPDGLGREVAFEIDAKVKKCRLPARVLLRGAAAGSPGTTWAATCKDIDGEFRFEDQGDGTTLADLLASRSTRACGCPGRSRKVLNDQVMKRSVEDLKRRVESLLGDGAAPQQPPPRPCRRGRRCATRSTARCGPRSSCRTSARGCRTSARCG